MVLLCSSHGSLCRCLSGLTCLRFQTALSESGAEPASVTGVGFDATCSLVVLDTDLRPLSVSPDGELSGPNPGRGGLFDSPDSGGGQQTRYAAICDPFPAVQCAYMRLGPRSTPNRTAVCGGWFWAQREPGLMLAGHSRQGSRSRT